MAKSEKKKTTEQVYNGILAGYGTDIAHCKVLAFTFEKSTDVELFHYRAMKMQHYYIFDGVADDKRATVVMKPDAVMEKAMTKAATGLGGIQYTPNLKL